MSEKPQKTPALEKVASDSSGMPDVLDMEKPGEIYNSDQSENSFRRQDSYVAQPRDDQSAEFST